MHGNIKRAPFGAENTITDGGSAAKIISGFFTRTGSILQSTLRRFKKVSDGECQMTSDKCQMARLTPNLSLTLASSSSADGSLRWGRLLPAQGNYQKIDQKRKKIQGLLRSD